MMINLFTAGAVLRLATSCGLKKIFPAAHVVRLEQNYRSTPHILGAASGGIDGNKGRLGKRFGPKSPKAKKSA